MPYVFGYGSLVDRASVEATLRRSLSTSPVLSRLHGYRRAWNVAGHTEDHPEFRCTRPDGSPWTGWVVSLGIEHSASSVTIGAVSRVSETDLERLDRREFSYDRVDVTALVDPAVDEPVHTYVPRRDVTERARLAAGRGTVTARYLRLVDRGYRALGEAAYAEHVATLPGTDAFRVEEVHVAPADSEAHNEVIDPAHG